MDNPYREPEPKAIPYTDKEMELWDAMIVTFTNREGGAIAKCVEHASMTIEKIIEFRRAKFGVR